ncbi:hypothetical protein TNCV_2391601 [Trichonephila clavipes]|nr:hypothetical protein TNCV_2391601 [Trichonephila clavipes]
MILLTLTGDTRFTRTPGILLPAVFKAPLCRVKLGQKDKQWGYVQPNKTTDPLTSRTKIQTLNNDPQSHVLSIQSPLLYSTKLDMYRGEWSVSMRRRYNTKSKYSTECIS